MPHTGIKKIKINKKWKFRNPVLHHYNMTHENLSKRNTFNADCKK